MASRAGPVTLAIDIGGTGLKAMLLDPTGHPLSERARTPTPRPATPAAVLRELERLCRPLAGYQRISVGFPGVVEDGVVFTAANLHPAWIGVDFARRLAHQFGVPVRVANDADVQGLGVVAGRGVELVLTLGTGMGSALFHDGRLVPNLQMAHQPFHRGATYEDRLGERAREQVGKKRWNKRLRAALETLDRAFNPRRIYLGGGNARHVTDPLPANVERVDNLAGLLGGVRLWDPRPAAEASARKRTGAPVRKRARPQS